MAALQETKNRTPCDPAILLQNIYRSELKGGLQRDICYEPVSIDGWTDEQNVVYPYNEILFSFEREDIDTYPNKVKP